MDKEVLHWIKGCRRQERNAQLNLYRRFARLLYVACLRITGNAEEAEEAMQDSFLKVFSRIDQYQEGHSFEAWIHQIAVHTAIDYVRRQHIPTEELTPTMAMEAEAEEDEQEEAIMASVEQVKEAALRLPTGFRVVLTLYLFEGYDMEEIASILNLQPSSVRSQYLRAKRKLVEMIQRN
ncbi:RNA polymerase sigma factor (sigma-70 family) [Parabacteroides sp. PFB2-10]|uniref:RNA polymerase sigma factor n=1 Tax=Parabacteroides sp. PFB2-10 TaxID=1742405 RepID=UPI002476600D|nr:sigma-70 family RNA polymerase sigma factor [Parabacteroides sp. PFB2-10]MDH6311571.1 RNA polymerase sigma factor (sigma-70 family) [Parabacteroides sp. PFB2-10]MDL2243991.1 sigma-70 family RNA polymerase sigma factor [Parabacteroides sp. OttesenSCG-928-J18]